MCSEESRKLLETTSAPMTTAGDATTICVTIQDVDPIIHFPPSGKHIILKKAREGPKREVT